MMGVNLLSYSSIEDRLCDREHTRIWERGNSLFPEYILVCDKLDESYVGMHTATANKRAIITCLEATKTSHAMTVARELGMICLGAEEESSELTTFLHQIQTGDLIHIKSNGKVAVAYLEKRREKNPYEGDIRK